MYMMVAFLSHPLARPLRLHRAPARGEGPRPLPHGAEWGAAVPEAVETIWILNLQSLCRGCGLRIQARR